MSTIIDLKTAIQQICLNMDITYLRASDLEANITLDNLGTDGKCIALHKDLTEVATTVTLGSYISKQITTEIYFLFLAPSIDEKLDDMDILFSRSEDRADSFYDRMLQYGILDDVVPAPGYNLQRQETFKIYDGVFTGVGFLCDFPVSRKTYYCGGVILDTLEDHESNILYDNENFPLKSTT